MIAAVACSRWSRRSLAFDLGSAQLDLGLAAPWHLLLMIEDGQIGFGTVAALVRMLGGLLACVTAAGGVAAAARRPPRSGASGSHAGPGALGSMPLRGAAPSWIAHLDA